MGRAYASLNALPPWLKPGGSSQLEPRVFSPARALPPWLQPGPGVAPLAEARGSIQLEPRVFRPGGNSEAALQSGYAAVRIHLPRLSASVRNAGDTGTPARVPVLSGAAPREAVVGVCRVSQGRTNRTRPRDERLRHVWRSAWSGLLLNQLTSGPASSAEPSQPALSAVPLDRPAEAVHHTDRGSHTCHPLQFLARIRHITGHGVNPPPGQGHLFVCQ